MRSINYCLNQQLTDICQRSLELKELLIKVLKLLPEPLAKQCQIGSFNKGCLVLTTTNAAWASQLRYALPELRDKLRKEAGMYQLSSIKVTLSEPRFEYELPNQQKKYLLSAKAKATIISESQHCTYEPLKKALLNLANND